MSPGITRCRYKAESRGRVTVVHNSMHAQTHSCRARREGWYALLASTLEHSRTCAQLRGLSPAALICALELSVVGGHLPASFRLSLAREALAAFATASDDASGADPAEPSNLHYKVQWTNMSSGTKEETGGSSVMHHGWLNVMNLSVASVETGVTQGDVVLAVALRNMLPDASVLGAADAELELPVACVRVTAASDLGFTTLEAHRLDAAQGWEACLGEGGAGDGKGGPGETINGRGDGPWRRTSHAGDDLAEEMTAAGTQASSEVLRGGVWTIYAARLRAEDAMHVQVHAVQVSLSDAASVTFMVGQLGDAGAGGSMEGVEAPSGMETAGMADGPPHIICGAPALGLQNGLVGRDAPFTTEPVPALAAEASGVGRAAAASAALPPAAAAVGSADADSAAPPLHLRAGVYGVSLRQRAPPAALVATGVPTALRVAECATAELRVTPNRTVSAGTPLWIRVRRDVAAPDADAAVDGGMHDVSLTDDAGAPSETASLCRVFVGNDADSAVEVTGTRELPLPALAVGAPCMMTAWLVGVGVGRVVVEGGLIWPGAESSQEPAVRAELQVAEPFGLQANFSAIGGRVVGMRAPEGEDSFSTARRVAAGALPVPPTCICPLCGTRRPENARALRGAVRDVARSTAGMCTMCCDAGNSGLQSKASMQNSLQRRCEGCCIR